MSGAGGVLGGRTFGEGALPSMGGAPAVFLSVPPNPTVAEREGEEEGDSDLADIADEDTPAQDEMEAEVASETENSEHRRLRRKEYGTDARPEPPPRTDITHHPTPPTTTARGDAPNGRAARRGQRGTNETK